MMQGCANSLLNKLLTVSISVYVNVSLSADAGDLAPRGRSEPEHQLPAARNGVSTFHSFGSKGFCLIREL